MTKSSLVFSAHNLQTYVDCARRFELSYLEELVWPADDVREALKSEMFMENGRIFHELVHRDILGIPVTAPANPEIARWWERYQADRPADVGGEKYPEKTLVGKIGDHVLVATYDLIVITPDETAHIFDWKTWRHPDRKTNLRERLQSRIYPYLLVEAAATLEPGLALLPENIQMHYWFTEQPHAPEVLGYSGALYAEARSYLKGLVDEILQTEAGDFPKTESLHQCKFCPYRSYCDRGSIAGSFEETDTLDETDLALELLGDLDDYEAVAF